MQISGANAIELTGAVGVIVPSSFWDGGAPRAL